jgi:hypothetical protein
MQKYISYAGLLFVTALLFVQPSRADSFGFDTFQLTGPGVTISFTLPSTLTPSSVDWEGLLSISNVAGIYDGAPYTFWTVQLGPLGYAFQTNYAATGSMTRFVEIVAPGLFTWNSDGTVSFNTGTFVLSNNSVVTVVDPPGPAVGTPEPASLLLLGVGGLPLLAVRRRRAV